jgi:cytochrome c biogenesis protein CcmG/thiol:disulfide interchange protein DsbE
MTNLDGIGKLCVMGVVSLTGGLVWSITANFSDRVVKIGDQAPDFAVVTDGGIQMSPGRFTGALLVLNFWATWCEGCLEEIQSLDRFQRLYADRGVQVLAVSMDDDGDQYRRFLRDFPMSFQTARDPSWKISHRYGTVQIPETFFIGGKGKILKRLIGAYNFMSPDFQAQIEGLLAAEKLAGGSVCSTPVPAGGGMVDSHIKGLTSLNILDRISAILKLQRVLCTNTASS